MSKIINASIDLTKIDKSQIKDHANGSKYYNIQIFLNDKPDQFGNTVSIANNQSKEQREAKTPKVYLGNGKVTWDSEAPKAAPAQAQQVSTPKNDLPWD